MELSEAVKTRRTVRLYKTDAIPRETVEALIDAARLAPSANNLQPWEFVAITKRETLEKISQDVPSGGFIAAAPLCIAVVCQQARHAVEDASAAVENLLLAAWDRGIGGCWISTVNEPVADRVRELVDGPADYNVIAIVALGYPAQKSECPPKRALKEVLHWEKF